MHKTEKALTGGTSSAGKDLEARTTTELSLAPASLNSLEQDLDENLRVTRELLTEVEGAYQHAKEKVSNWNISLAEARRILFYRIKEATLSRNARITATQMIDDAKDRIQAIEEHELNGKEEQLAELRKTEEALSSLKARLELQRYRESFTSKTVSIADRKSATGTLDMDSIEAIDREVRSWSHTITAWKELQA